MIESLQTGFVTGCWLIPLRTCGGRPSGCWLPFRGVQSRPGSEPPWRGLACLTRSNAPQDT
jgi:hypothetical protein